MIVALGFSTVRDAKLGANPAIAGPCASAQVAIVAERTGPALAEFASTMSIFEVLGRQQHQIEELIEDTIQQMAKGQRELAFVTFQLLSNKLIACMRAEHATVYPRLERDASLVTEVAQARAEHEAIEDAITRLRVAGLRRSAWLVELSNLARLVERHAELEEFTLFPIAALTFSSEQLAEMGEQFTAALAMASTVADAAITYETAELEPPPTRIVRVKAA